MADKIMGLSKPQLAIVGVGGAVTVFLVFKHMQASSSAASNTSASSGATDGSIDPATGYAYGSPEDQAALAEQQSGGISGVGASDGLDSEYYPATATTSTSPQTNSQWAQTAQQDLVNIGYDPETVAGAIGAYLGGIALTPTQVGIVQVALAEAGPPPTGSYSIITQGTTGGGTTGSTSTGSTSTGTSTGTTSAYITATPANLKVVSLNATSVQLQFSPVTGATGYGVETYDSAGNVVNGPFTTQNTIANVGGLKTKTTYHTNVWADPAKTGGPHSSVTFTTK
jgi:hypothetical protein